jgi:hypothetical protein
LPPPCFCPSDPSFIRSLTQSGFRPYDLELFAHLLGNPTKLAVPSLHNG